ncbi:MAG: DUF4268 domain-containing protein [Phycisphaerales bacterium]|nr:DUF4268 domain-containing protein [Phycisphaerales bacterium]
MSLNEMGRLERVDLRTIWNSEPGDFTPWLAEESSLKLLGETIGIDLELEAQEKDVGPFRADILCKNTISNEWVLIENQLEKTDHTHLGQLMTYAAGLNTVTIVWIALRFTDEHRAALDWLNGITEDRFSFFGLEIEAWRIGESPIAPKFSVVCKPNDWTKSVHTSVAGGELTETRQLQQHYWATLSQYLVDSKSAIKSQKAHPNSSADFALGRTNLFLRAFANMQAQRISVTVVCNGPDGKAFFHLLKRDQMAIESELDFQIVWNELPGIDQSRIEIRNENADPRNQDDWMNQHKWMAERLEALHGVFSSRVKKLDVSEYEELVDQSITSVE